MEHGAGTTVACPGERTEWQGGRRRQAGRADAWVGAWARACFGAAAAAAGLPRRVRLRPARGRMGRRVSVFAHPRRRLARRWRHPRARAVIGERHHALAGHATAARVAAEGRAVGHLGPQGAVMRDHFSLACCTPRRIARRAPAASPRTRAHLAPAADRSSQCFARRPGRSTPMATRQLHALLVATVLCAAFLAPGAVGAHGRCRCLQHRRHSQPAQMALLRSPARRCLGAALEGSLARRSHSDGCRGNAGAGRGTGGASTAHAGLCLAEMRGKRYW